MSELLNSLHDQALESVTFDDETHQWVFVFSDRLVLQVDAPWRVVSDGQIVLGWQDDGHQFGLPAPLDAIERLNTLIVDSCVTTAALGLCGDLQISFRDGSTLDVFNASFGYEGWILHAPDNQWVVAQGGGNVAESGDDA